MLATSQSSLPHNKNRSSSSSSNHSQESLKENINPVSSSSNLNKADSGIMSNSNANSDSSKQQPKPMKYSAVAATPNSFSSAVASSVSSNSSSAGAGNNNSKNSEGLKAAKEKQQPFDPIKQSAPKVTSFQNNNSEPPKTANAVKPPVLSYAAKARTSVPSTPKPAPAAPSAAASAVSPTTTDGRPIKFGSFEKDASTPSTAAASPKLGPSTVRPEMPTPTKASSIASPLANFNDIKRMQTAPPVLLDQPQHQSMPIPPQMTAGMLPNGQPIAYRPFNPQGGYNGVPAPRMMPGSPANPNVYPTARPMGDFRPRPPYIPGGSPAPSAYYGPPQPYHQRPAPPQGYATNYYAVPPYGAGVPFVPSNAGINPAAAPAVEGSPNFIRPARKKIVITDPNTGKQLDFKKDTTEEKKVGEEEEKAKATEIKSEASTDAAKKSDIEPRPKSPTRKASPERGQVDAKSGSVEHKVEAEKTAMAVVEVKKEVKETVSVKKEAVSDEKEAVSDKKETDATAKVSTERKRSPERKASPERSTLPPASSTIKKVEEVVAKETIKTSPAKPKVAAPPGLTLVLKKDEKEDGEVSDDEVIKRRVLNVKDLTVAKYPAAIPSPVVSKSGKSFYYSRDFLMAVGEICKEKPDDLPNIDGIFAELDITSPTFKIMHSNGRSDSQRSSSARYDSGKSQGPSQMRSDSGRSSGGPRGPNYGDRDSQRPGRQPPHGSNMSGPIRTRSGRGGPRMHPNQMGGRVHSNHRGGSSRGGHMDHQPEKVEKLVRSANAWVRPASEKLDELESLGRKIRGILNKLTLERFESLSDKILHIGITNTIILKEVIGIIFDKAVDEPNFSEIYAKLCAKLSNQLDPHKIAIIDDHEMKVSFDRGVHPFRRLLLNKCQSVFEKRETWTSAANATTDDKEGSGKEKTDTPATVAAEDEDYEMIKLKRRVLGNVRFIGELYKLGMLGEKIMHRCILMLLKVESPVEEEIESLCNLLTTIGKNLDHEEAQSHMNEYFNRLKLLSESSQLPSRIQFMILDVIDLRSRKWKPRREAAGPKTLDEIHREAARQQEAAERNSRRYDDRRSSSMRGGARGGGSGSGASRDLHRVSSNPKFSKSGSGRGSGNTAASRNTSQNQRSHVPSGINTVKDESSARTLSQRASPSEPPSLSRSNSSINMFGALADADNGSVEVEAEEETIHADAGEESLGGELLERKFQSIINEYMHVKDLEEGALCIKEVREQLSEPKFDLFVSLLINKVLEMKEKDVESAIGFLGKLVEDKLITSSDLLKGMSDSFETVEDISIDVPGVFKYVGIIIGFTISVGAFDSLKEVIQGCLGSVLSSKSRRPPILKILPDVFLSIKKARGVSFTQQFYHGVDSAFLMGLMGSGSQSSEGVAEFLSSSNLGFLNAAKVSDEDAVDQYIAKGDYEACLEWFYNRGESSYPAGLIKHTFGAVCKVIYAKVFENRKDVNDTNYKTSILNSCKLLRGLCEDRQDVQLQLIHSICDFWHVSIFELRDEYLRNMFASFYDEDIIQEDIFMQWTESALPSNSTYHSAYMVVKQWIGWLKVAEEEETDEITDCIDDEEEGEPGFVEEVTPDK